MCRRLTLITRTSLVSMKRLTFVLSSCTVSGIVSPSVQRRVNPELGATWLSNACAAEVEAKETQKLLSRDVGSEWNPKARDEAKERNLAVSMVKYDQTGER